MIPKFKQFESKLSKQEIMDEIKDCSYNITDKYETKIWDFNGLIMFDIDCNLLPITITSISQLKLYIDENEKEKNLYLEILEFLSRLSGIKKVSVYKIANKIENSHSVRISLDMGIVNPSRSAPPWRRH